MTKQSEAAETIGAVGIIGGTGLYELPGVEIISQELPDTPFGAPSSPLVQASIDGQQVFFLARHGEHHALLPHEINYRANIFALKAAGVTRCLSLCAAGSLSEAIAPGDFVVADQIIDFTVRRNVSFLGQGLAGYPSLANPLTKDTDKQLTKALEQVTSAKVHSAGTYLCIEGPQLSSRAESEMFRLWKADIIGMTACPEVQLACEAQMSFSIVAMVSDYDCWKDGHEAVSVAGVLKVLKRSTAEIQAAMPEILKVLMSSERSLERSNSLRSALMGSPEDASKQELLNVLLR